MSKTYCWFCGSDTPMIWNCDYSFNDYGYDGEGIIAVLTCPNCGATAEFMTKMEEEDL